MTPPRKVRFERLTAAHERAEFACEHQSLSDFLVRFAGQNMRGDLAACYVAVRPHSMRVIGYYTLSAYAVLVEELPETEQKGLPRYDRVPAFLIGRLARDVSFKGSGLGELLLADSIKRLAASEPAGRMIIVDPIDATAASFYARYGFAPLGPATARLFLPMKAARKLLSPGEVR